MNNLQYILFTDLIPNAIVEVKTAIKKSKELLEKRTGKAWEQK